MANGMVTTVVMIRLMPGIKVISEPKAPGIHHHCKVLISYNERDLLYSI
jgi:hypothetical protein